MHDKEIQSCIRAALKRRSNSAFLRLVKYVLPIINECVDKFNIHGRDQEDIKAECIISLWTEVLPRFDPKRGKFRTFTGVVIRRRLISLILAEQKQKRRTLNKALSLFAVGQCGKSLLDITPNPNAIAPYEIAADSDEREFWIKKVQSRLTKLEGVVFQNFLQEKSYKEIAVILGISSTKPVDNALTRSRGKAEPLLGLYNRRTYY